jgi:hypothetical protein
MSSGEVPRAQSFIHILPNDLLGITNEHFRGWDDTEFTLDESQAD